MCLLIEVRLSCSAKYTLSPSTLSESAAIVCIFGARRLSQQYYPFPSPETVAAIGTQRIPQTNDFCRYKLSRRDGKVWTGLFHLSAWRNCLENSRKRLSAPLWWQEAPELGLLPPLLAALGAPIRDLSRISKQFRKECSRKFVPGVAPSLRREASA